MRYHNYKPLAWAEGINKIIHYYGTEVRFISMAAEGDIQKLASICKAHKLNFWSKVYKEYRVLYQRLKMGSNKDNKTKLNIEEGWENFRVFGSLYNNRIKERNERGIIQKNDEFISIFNDKCFPFPF